MRWTPEEILKAREIVSRHRERSAVAAAEVSDAIGRHVTRHALERALKRSAHVLQSELVNPLAAWMPADGPTELTTRVAIIPDTHVPYHDKKAWPLALRAIREFRPDVIVMLGDFADFQAVSFHDKSINRLHRLKDEVAAVNEELDHISAIGAKRVIYIEGNHTYRLQRYLSQRAPELDGFVRTAAQAFKVQERGWEWVPYRQGIAIGKLWFTHDCGHSGLTAAARSRDSYGASVVVGHCHNATISYRGDARGQPHVGMACGWLGDASSIDYMHQIQLRNWQLGFGVAYVEASGNCHVHFLPIVDGHVVVEGKVVT